jgi:hypothetical protein
MVAGLDNTKDEVKVADILAGCGVAKKDACKVVPIQFATSESRALYAYLRTEHLEMCDVWFTTITHSVGVFFDG